jgi:hypothetical protein
MTPDAEDRSRRALAAARTKFQAGAVDDTLQLLATAETGGLSELQRAQVDLLRAETVFVVTRGRDAPPLLVEAARRLRGSIRSSRARRISRRCRRRCSPDASPHRA